jgi:hypothetical protein
MKMNNKHLLKIVSEYINIDIIYKKELLNKTSSIDAQCNYWYFYDKYISCSVETGIAYNKGYRLDGHFYFININTDWWCLEYKPNP